MHEEKDFCGTNSLLELHASCNDDNDCWDQFHGNAVSLLIVHTLQLLQAILWDTVLCEGTLNLGCS